MKKKILKDFIANGVINLARSDWESNNKIRVLIQLNKYFTKESWLAAFRRHLAGFPGFCHLRLTANKPRFIKLARNADICFCFGLSRYMDLNHSGLKLIYFGLRGLEFLEEKDIPSHIQVVNCPAPGAEITAEYCLMTSLMLLRRFQYALLNQNKRKWNQLPLLLGGAGPLKTKKIGILGVGKNGSAAARLFKTLGCYTVGYDLAPDPQNKNIDQWFSPDQEDDFFSITDIFIITLPLNKQTRHFIDREKLKKMKKDAFLVNTGRGEVVVEKDLVMALENREIGGAALDVFAVEPLPRFHRFWRMKNVIISPHIAGNINLFIPQVQEDFISHIKKLKPGEGKNV